MELEWSKKKLLDLVKKAYFGELMLPDFQRNFVWTRNDIEELISSLLEKMFIGTFLIQRVNPNNIPFKIIPIEGVTKINKDFTPEPEILVLDGQQRLTSLFYALYSPNIPLRNTAHPYAFFLDLEKLAKDDVEEGVFSWSKEWREYKLLLNEAGNYDLSKLKEHKLIPLSFLSNESEFWRLWYKEFTDLFDSNNLNKIERYLKNITDYQVHVLSIPLTEKPEDIAILFERINRTGVRLSVFDLLTARMYKFINLRMEWENAFEENYWIRKMAKDNKKNTKVPYYVVQGLALSNGMSIKAREMIKIDSTILNKETWDKAISVLENKVLKRLFDVSEYGIASYRWFPYPSIISVWVALFLKSEELNIDIDKINRWYWSVIFTERYSSSTETKQSRDFKELLTWFEEPKLPEAVKHAIESLKVMKLNTKHGGSSIYKGVFNLLFRNGARDFYEKDGINYSLEQLDDHHIFPRRFLEKKGVNVEKDIILNRTLILSSTNRRISGRAPATYIQKMVEIHDSEEDVKRVLRKHFINGEMFEILMDVTEDLTSEEVKEKFDRFISLREVLIKGEIGRLIMGPSLDAF